MFVILYLLQQLDVSTIKGLEPRGGDPKLIGIKYEA